MKAVGLGVGVDQVIEGVFLGEEIFQFRVAGQRGLVEETDIAASAERSKRPFLVDTAYGHGQHLIVVAPCQQRLCERADHRQRQGVQCPGSVQCQAPYAPLHFHNHMGFKAWWVHGLLSDGVGHCGRWFTVWIRGVPERERHPSISLITRAVITTLPPIRTS
jgi:hypothetical protein